MNTAKYENNHGSYYVAAHAGISAYLNNPIAIAKSKDLINGFILDKRNVTWNTGPSFYL